VLPFPTKGPRVDLASPQLVVITHRDDDLRDALQREPFQTEASTGKNAALNGGRAGAITSMLRHIYAVNTGVADPGSRQRRKSPAWSTTAGLQLPGVVHSAQGSKLRHITEGDLSGERTRRKDKGSLYRFGKGANPSSLSPDNSPHSQLPLKRSPVRAIPWNPRSSCRLPVHPGFVMTAFGSRFIGCLPRLPFGRLSRGRPPSTRITHGLPARGGERQHISRGVHVSIVMGSATRAVPFTRVQVQFGKLVPAARAGLAGGIPTLAAKVARKA
jgi:hypothetical protein